MSGLRMFGYIVRVFKYCLIYLARYCGQGYSHSVSLNYPADGGDDLETAAFISNQPDCTF